MITEEVVVAKYIIELEEDPFVSLDSADVLYRAKGFKSLVFDARGLQKLTPYTENMCKQKCNFRVGDIISDCNFIGVVYKSHEDGFDVFWKDVSSTRENDVTMQDAYKIGATDDVEKTIHEWVNISLFSKGV